MKRKVCAILCLIVVAAGLCGCAGDAVELSARGIVGALGIDYSGGKYRVSILALNADTAENTQKAYNVDYIFGEGAALRDAFARAGESTSKNLFYGHNTILVLGKTLARDRLHETVAYLAQNKETRLNVSVFLAEKDAREVILLNTGDKGRAGGSIEKLATGDASGYDVKVQLFSLLTKLPEEGICGIIPILHAVEVESKTDSQSDEPVYDLCVERVALFRRGKMLAEVGGEMLAGVMLLDNRVHAVPLQIRDSGGTDIYAELRRARVSVRYDEQVRRATVTLRGNISVTGQGSFGEGADMRELKEAFSARCAEMAASACDAYYNTLGWDALNLEWHMAQATSAAAVQAQLLAGDLPEIEVVCALLVIS